jgi:hypothetical protein
MDDCHTGATARVVRGNKATKMGKAKPKGKRRRIRGRTDGGCPGYEEEKRDKEGERASD